MNSLKEIGNVLSSLRKVSVFTHTRPDGDAIGSAMSLSLVLDSIGVENEVVCDMAIPETFRRLPKADRFRTEPKLDADMLVLVDCADENRTGRLADFILRSGKKIINIDHHVSNTRFGAYNYVHECSANCQNMANLFAEMGVKLTPDAATYLMTGILTDSGTFSHSDVDKETFRIAGDLLESGSELSSLIYQLFRRQRKERFLLNQRVMQKVRFALDDRLTFLTVLQSDLAAVGAKAEMTEGFVDYPLTVDSVEVSVALLEVKPRQFKVSLRSKGKVNVNQVAACYGGGGHVLASGCMIFGDVEEVVDRLTYTVSQHMV
ncbi:MAG: bifunctional oligoribonuclease/PAP phosphatase NrnA [Christensenellaceae bacterium]